MQAIKTTREKLESEIRDRVQAKIDSGIAKSLRKCALEDLIEQGSDAGGYLGNGGSYSGEELQRLAKEWKAIRNLAKIELRRVKNDVEWVKENAWQHNVLVTMEGRN